MPNKSYTGWLMDQCQLESYGAEGYVDMCTVLQRMYFVSLIEFDENRVEEGKELREEWAETQGGDIHDLGMIPYTCTALEMILVMARRMCFEMSDSQYEAGVGKWVMELLENAGLATYRNDIYETDPDYCCRKIKAIMNDIIYRRYLPDGQGSFFPMNESHGDARQMELLVQMNNYLAENYDIC